MNAVQNRTQCDKKLGNSRLEWPSNFEGGRETTVILLNDNDTTKRYVVIVLDEIFGLRHNKSVEVMEHTHSTGSGIIGYYPERKALRLLKELDKRNAATCNKLRCIMINTEEGVQLERKAYNKCKQYIDKELTHSLSEVHRTKKLFLKVYNAGDLQLECYIESSQPFYTVLKQ